MNGSSIGETGSSSSHFDCERERADGGDWPNLGIFAIEANGFDTCLTFPSDWIRVPCWEPWRESSPIDNCCWRSNSAESKVSSSLSIGAPSLMCMRGVWFADISLNSAIKSSVARERSTQDMVNDEHYFWLKAWRKSLTNHSHQLLQFLFQLVEMTTPVTPTPGATPSHTSWYNHLQFRTYSLVASTSETQLGINSLHSQLQHCLDKVSRLPQRPE